MKTSSQFSKIAIAIERDDKFQFTIFSFLIVFFIYVNLSFIHSLAIGIITTLIYFLVNGTFLGHAFFKHEAPFLRLILGNLLLITFLGIIAWSVMITYNLDIIRSAISLTIVTILSSFSNNSQKKRREYRKTKYVKEEGAETPSNEQRRRRLLVPELLYSFLSVLLFYLLFSSRSGEVYTIRGVINPLFFPVFCVATFLLVTIIFSSEKTQYKLLLTIVHSILSYIFFVAVFPAGNLGPQQWILGRTRLVFDNITVHGNWWTTENVLLQIYRWGRGDNFQAALSVILARMLSVDVYWPHLLLVPLLWGVFAPVIALVILKTLGASDDISILSSLVVLLFPSFILWGAVSIPNSLSYLFFFCSLYFLLKYLGSPSSRGFFLALVFSLVSFLSHFLSGTMAFSLLLLVNSIRTYEKEKGNSPVMARLQLLLSFFFCASILPFVLVYRRFFFPTANTYFSLEKLYGLPSTGIVLSLLFGSYFDLISREAYITAIILGIPSMLGLIGMICILYASAKKTPKKNVDPCMLFLFVGLLLIIVDDRVVKLFMMNLPFVEFERLWLLRDFLLISFLTLFIKGAIREVHAFFDRFFESILSFKRKMSSLPVFSKISSLFQHPRLVKDTNFASALAHIILFIIISYWVTASVYYAYPQYGPLQTTSYELEAVKYIDETTKEKYIVIADQWIILAGQMFVGINNPRAFYFSHVDPSGVTLFIKMERNPSNETLIDAMKTNNATVAYFIIEKPRIGTETYNDIIEKAQQNNIQTYKVFPENEEKLRIFYYRKP